MKRIAILILAFSLSLFFLTACASNDNTTLSESTAPVVTSESPTNSKSMESATQMLISFNQDKDIIQTIQSSSDYLYASPEDVIGHSQVLVKGTFTEFIGSYVDEYGIIRSQYKFIVQKTINGDLVKDQEIIIDLYGGTVAVDEYLLHFDEIDASKMGLNKNEKHPDKFITSLGEPGFLPKNNLKYILALNSSEAGIYAVNCGEYGQFENKNDAYYSIFSKKELSEVELGQYVQ